MDLHNKVALPENAPLSTKVSKMIVIFGFFMIIPVCADVFQRNRPVECTELAMGDRA